MHIWKDVLSIVLAFIAAITIGVFLELHGLSHALVAGITGGVTAPYIVRKCGIIKEKRRIRRSLKEK